MWYRVSPSAGGLHWCTSETGHTDKNWAQKNKKCHSFILQIFINAGQPVYLLLQGKSACFMEIFNTFYNFLQTNKQRSKTVNKSKWSCIRRQRQFFSLITSRCFLWITPHQKKSVSTCTKSTLFIYSPYNSSTSSAHPHLSWYNL